MFSAIGLACTELDLHTCQLVHYADLFRDMSACETFLNQMLGATIQLGTIVMASCINVGLGV